jgi:peptidoglycan/LPS O-acetylase OafA/YrhL
MNLVAQTIPNVAPVRPRTFMHMRELDGVRGLAALMVFLHHVCFTSIRQAIGVGRCAMRHSPTM